MPARSCAAARAADNLSARRGPYRYWPVLVLAGWAAVASSLWQWSARNADAPRLLSDAGGAPTLVVTAVNSARRAVLRNASLVSDLVNALPSEVRVLVLSNDPDAFEVRGNENSRVEFVTVPATVPITIWPQDPFLVLAGRGTGAVLLRSRRFERAGDEVMAEALATHLRWEMRTSSLSFEGGNVVGGEQHVFVGADTVRLNAIELDIDEADVVRRFEAELGRPVRVVGPVPQPVGHLDMILTPLGDGRIALGDPGAGAAIARRALAEDADAVTAFEDTVGRNFFGDPRITELTLPDGDVIRPPPLQGMTDEAIGRSEAMAPLYDAIANALAVQGYQVVRIPFLSNLAALDRSDGPPPRPYREVLDYPVLTYNNVVLGEVAGVPRVYLPRYGFPALDRAATAAWEALGYQVQAVDGFATSALYGGALRCTLKVLERF